MATRVFTEDEFLQLGLQMRSNGTKTRNYRQRSRMVEDFRAIYGPHPAVLAALWIDLQTTPYEADRIDSVTEPSHLLIVYRWLRSYESEKELRTNFGPDEKQIRKWCKEITAKIAALRKMKV